MDYTPIESIDDVDPDKISIRDINKRYIDRQGNRFALRFNMKERKVEIVRLVKGRVEAIKIRHEIIQTKREERLSRTAAKSQPLPSAGEDDLSLDAAPEPVVDAPESNTGAFDEPVFIQETMRDVEKMRERVLGILNNVKRSTHYEHKKDQAWSQVEREADSEVITRLEKTMNNHKELYQYPRSVSYYASRLSTEHREQLDKMETDEHKLEWIRRWETQDDLHGLYTKLEEFATRLKIVLDMVPEKELSSLPAANVQAFRDAKASANFLIQDAVEKLGAIETWRSVCLNRGFSRSTSAAD